MIVNNNYDSNESVTEVILLQAVCECTQIRVSEMRNEWMTPAGTDGE